ncbi:MAG: hypothetical protein AAF226_02050 [Verrucomicrobiota bacterium]
MTAKEKIAENWKGKLASLVLAVVIWFLIDTHLDREKQKALPPVPGTLPEIDVNPLSPIGPPIPGE